MAPIIVVTYTDDTPDFEFQMRGKWAMAAEVRFPKFDVAKKITATYQAAYCAARAAGETRSFEAWCDLVEFETPDQDEGVEPGEAAAAAAAIEDSSAISQPSPRNIKSRRAS